MPTPVVKPTGDLLTADSPSTEFLTRSDLDASATARYVAHEDKVVRYIQLRNGSWWTSEVEHRATASASAFDAFDQSWLRSPEPPNSIEARGRVRVVDLFSGCGGLSLGVWEACRAVGLEMEAVAAFDTDECVLSTYLENFGGEGYTQPVEDMVAGTDPKSPTRIEQKLAARLGPIDIMLAGPPCQGHSDLNNHTRRSDPKNLLYLSVARFATIVRPRHLIVENVPGVVHDRKNVVGLTWRILRELGYRIDGAVLDASLFGAAQRRRRYFTVASLDTLVTLPRRAPTRERERPFRWACGDLREVHDSVFDTPARHSAENRRRIQYLFSHGLYDLPDSERPACHRLKQHSYKAVYGRMRHDRPAPTVTAGFGSTGQGRFVHPHEPRSITPHEAARLQFMPDFFRFSESRRTVLQKMIGNAVPPILGYSVALEILR